MAQISVTLGEYIIKTAHSWLEARRGVVELGDHLLSSVLGPKDSHRGGMEWAHHWFKTPAINNKGRGRNRLKEEVRTFGSLWSLHPAPDRPVAAVKCHLLPTEPFPINVIGS